MTDKRLEEFSPSRSLIHWFLGGWTEAACLPRQLSTIPTPPQSPRPATPLATRLTTDSPVGSFTPAGISKPGGGEHQAPQGQLGGMRRGQQR